jgi:predicted nucleotidyltransferase
MGIKDLKEKNLIIFEAITGSYAYGTNVEGSDMDIKGVFIQPTEEILRGEYIPQISDETQDTVYYEINRFLELLSQANPNVLELLYSPIHCIRIIKEEFRWLLNIKYEFLTKDIVKSFIEYSKTQIKKSRGLGKKIFNPQPEKRKDILEFCYVIEGNKSLNFWSWFDKNYFTLNGDYVTNKSYVVSEIINKWGLSKVQNGDQLYVIYENNGSENFRGLIKDLNSTELRLSSISKEYEENNIPVLMWFNLDGFKIHCKEHKSYWEWVEKRNKIRYDDNINGETGYDKKNMLHVLRLLYTAKDIIDKNEVVVFRPEREFLISIRKGMMNFHSIVNKADELVEYINSQENNLRDSIDSEKIKNLLLKYRLNNFNNNKLEFKNLDPYSPTAEWIKIK